MKSFITLCLLSFSLQGFALDCLEEAKAATLKQASKTLKVAAANLRVRYIGGESLDSDSDNDGRYVSPSYEYFDVFVKGNSKTAAAMYTVELYTISEEETEEVVACDIGDVNDVEKSEWKNIYKMYL